MEHNELLEQYQNLMIEVMIENLLTATRSQLLSSKAIINEAIHQRWQKNIDARTYKHEFYTHRSRILFLEHELSEIKKDLRTQFFGAKENPLLTSTSIIGQTVGKNFKIPVIKIILMSKSKYHPAEEKGQFVLSRQEPSDVERLKNNLEGLSQLAKKVAEVKATLNDYFNTLRKNNFGFANVCTQITDRGSMMFLLTRENIIEEKIGESLKKISLAEIDGIINDYTSNKIRMGDGYTTTIDELLLNRMLTIKQSHIEKLEADEKNKPKNKAGNR